VIPKSVRTELGLEEGQDVLVTVEKGRIVIEPFPYHLTTKTSARETPGSREMNESFPRDPFKVLDLIIDRPYREDSDEPAVERWLKKSASGRH